VRDDSGAVERIVETKNPQTVPTEILAIREINTGTYCFDGPRFAAALAQITNDNEAGEYYLGDVLPLLRADGGTVAAHVAPDANANLGVNNRADLAMVTAEARRQILHRHMLAGVTVTDPQTTWVDADVELAEDVTLEPGTYLRGRTSVGPNSVIGPHTTAIDTRIGSGSRAIHAYMLEASVGDECSVGPFAYLRPGAVLERGSKIGTFVEVKNSRIGEGAKVPHLSYVGDADVGERANLGAGTITANYDGSRKHRTRVGADAKVGVDTALVAPVDVGEGAYTGAGAVIRSDVPPGALGVNDVEQRTIDDYARRRAEREEKELTDPGDPK
jgi:bifunctional UDP-N-acetylglucosamine pyrophosphorylase/glucosamine-1-phosphate N-acetyltransferase